MITFRKLVTTITLTLTLGCMSQGSMVGMTPDLVEAEWGQPIRAWEAHDGVHVYVWTVSIGTFVQLHTLTTDRAGIVVQHETVRVALRPDGPHAHRHGGS